MAATGWPRDPLAAARVHRNRGTRAGHGRARANARAAGDDAVGAALDKFLRALPANVARQAIAMRQHAAAAPDHRSRPDPIVAADLIEAVASKRRITVTYRNESGRSWTGDIDPWAVVIRHGRWYLACFSHRAGALRTFRVDRVLAVVQLDAVFEPPADIDPVALLEEQLGRGWKYRTRVRFHTRSMPCGPSSPLRWARSKRSMVEPDATSSAAPATRRCMHANGWRGCPSPSQ